MNDINCQIACYCGCGLCPPYFDDVSDLQLYDISFLKLSELLLEANPGPTQNVSKSQVNSIKQIAIMNEVLMPGSEATILKVFMLLIFIVIEFILCLSILFIIYYFFYNLIFKDIGTS